MVFALLACVTAFQGLTTPIPEHPVKKPATTKRPVTRKPVKKDPPAKKPEKKPEAPKKTESKVAAPKAKDSKVVPADKKVVPPTPPAKNQDAQPPVFKDEPAGTGAPVKAGETVVVHFRITRRSGDEIADSKKRGLPYVVKIGAPGNDPLLDLVLKGMKPGGVRSTTIAAKTVYGPGGAPPIILPNDTLLVTVTLLRRGDK